MTSVNKILYNSATQPYFEDDFQLDKYETSVAHYFLNIFTVCHVIYFLRDSFSSAKMNTLKLTTTPKVLGQQFYTHLMLGFEFRQLQIYLSASPILQHKSRF